MYFPPHVEHAIVALVQEGAQVPFRWTPTYVVEQNISHKTLNTLRPDEWVDSLAVEWCLCLVAQRASNASLRTAVCSPSLYQVQPGGKQNPDSPTTAASKASRWVFKELDVILFPVYSDSHWSLVALCHPGLASPQAVCLSHRSCVCVLYAHHRKLCF